MYIKIDELHYHGASPFFLVDDISKFGSSVNNHKEPLETFSGKLTKFISRRIGLSKPAERVLKVLIEKHIDNDNLENAIEVDTYQMMEDSGYKNVSSVYVAIGILCSKNILALSDERGKKGSLMIFANPLIFGQGRVVVGDIVEVIS